MFEEFGRHNRSDDYLQYRLFYVCGVSVHYLGNSVMMCPQYEPHIVASFHMLYYYRVLVK